MYQEDHEGSFTKMKSIATRVLRRIWHEAYYRIHQYRNRNKSSIITRLQGHAKSIAIIGNGPIDRDVSEVVDECDIVIRFNAARNWGGNAGRRFDVLVLAVGATNLLKLRGSEFLQAASEIWFEGNSLKKTWEETPQTGQLRSARFYKNRSKAILAANRLKQPVWAINQSVRALASNELARFSENPARAVDPSNGMATICACRQYFPNATLKLVGFGFFGTGPHDWNAEREYVAA